VVWLLEQQNPDGSFIQPDMQADVYHKGILALAVTGHAVEASRLLTWIKAHDLQEGGRLRHYDDGLALYKTSWACQGAHRLGRFDISLPVMEYILSCQAPCGGFFQTQQLTEYIEPVCTAWAGVAALYTGRLDAAKRTAECLQQMVAQQPDPQRWYFHMSPDGQLLTGEGAPFVDATKTQQAYYCPGIAMLFMARLDMATGGEAYLRGARGLFDFSLRCAEDAYAYPASGKSAVGAALLYAFTGDERALQAAITFGDYLVREQKADGWWCNPHSDHMIIRLDHTAEFIIWLTDIAGALGGTIEAR
jgi:hypothetical protein